MAEGFGTPISVPGVTNYPVGSATQFLSALPIADERNAASDGATEKGAVAYMFAGKRKKPQEESVRHLDNALVGPGSLTVESWFDTIAGIFPLDELHLFSKDLKYLFSARAKRRKGETAVHFPKEKSIFDVADKAFAALIISNLDRVLKGETVSFEAEHRGKKHLFHAIPMYNPADQETYVLVQATDVTELKGLRHKSSTPGEAGVKEFSGGAAGSPVRNVPQNETYFDLTPVAMFFADGEGKIVAANKRFRGMIGYGEKKVSGLALYDLVPDFLPGAWREQLREIQRKGRFSRKVDLKHSDGRMVKTEIEFTPAQSATGELACASVRRVADGCPTEEDFLQSEERFRLISENVPDLVAMLDLKGRHVYVNPAYKSIISNPESLLGKEVLDIVHPDDRNKVRVVLREGLVSGLEQRIEFRMMAPDGSVRYVEARGKAVHDPDGKLRNAVVVTRDVTERKKVEEQFFRNQRIESLGTLAGGISHDLNNVLTPVILGVEALKRVHMDERGLAILNSIGTSLSRGRDIVKQVLTFARGVEGETMLIQVRHIVNESVSLMKEIFPKSIAIVENVPKSLWLIDGDATRMNQLLMNLGVNARDAMPEGGILYVSAENILIDEQFAAMKPEAKPGPYVRITVQDTGVGMSQEVKEHIFEPFFTTKETGKGTGLGLSIVYSIVKSHGGFIAVESEQGKGTTFNVYFPAVEVSESDRPMEADGKLLAGHGELLLVVDDEVSVCQITKQTLEAFGYNALTATDGTEAVALFAENREKVSLVVMDIAMPIMDGPRTIRALRKLKPDIKIIASSGIVPEDQLLLEDSAAPNAFLPKPFTSARLLQSIRSVLETNRKK